MILILIGLLVFLLFCYFVLRRDDEQLSIPMVQTDRWPVLGHIVPFLQDKSKFLLKCQRLYGARFAIKMLNQRMFFLLDPADWLSVNRNSVLLLPSKDFAAKIFNVSPVLLNEEQLLQDLHRLFKVHLQNSDGLNPLTIRFVQCARDLLINDRKLLSDGQWSETGLFEFSRKMIYEPSSRALFGDIHPNLIENSYRVFDKKVHHFAASLPAWFYSLFFSKEVKARETVATFLRTNRFAQNESRLAFERAKQILECDQKFEENLGYVQTSILWAALGNTMPATFWTLLYILKDEVALKKILEEIEIHLPRFSLTDENDRTYESWTAERLSRCVLLDSAVSEVLRLKGTPLVRRDCPTDTEITFSDGNVLKVRAGDVVFMYPEPAHYDERFFIEPQNYQFDRFIGKTADTVKGYMPFGAGRSMCPGRHFAKNEIKTCVALIIYFIEYEFLSPTEVPKVEKHRIGFGVSTPDHDIRIRYRYKRNS